MAEALVISRRVPASVELPVRVVVHVKDGLDDDDRLERDAAILRFDDVLPFRRSSDGAGGGSGGIQVGDDGCWRLGRRRDVFLVFVHRLVLFGCCCGAGRTRGTRAVQAAAALAGGVDDEDHVAVVIGVVAG
eukprot:CAMPEP_0119553538 /NCGR_PEP_ID=MMETSP1352-20130426/6271_1 /TAXON_ID=265584 /ORGANISM="Stauroneis constricta, Strain CCMP1120" /LENGTH=131 /DNA_ID=CAMNT_0007599969 /DNA_START=824 /DNA_END=1215 /DNA_ORIENTATION=-